MGYICFRLKIHFKKEHGHILVEEQPMRKNYFESTKSDLIK